MPLVLKRHTYNVFCICRRDTEQLPLNLAMSVNYVHHRMIHLMISLFAVGPLGERPCGVDFEFHAILNSIRDG